MTDEDAPPLATGRSPLRSSVLMFENSQIVHLAVGRSTVRRRILALLLTEPGPRLHLREIQRRAATSPGTASRELAKLVSAGLIERETEANQVYFRGSASPFATILRSFLVSAPTPPPASSELHGDGTRSAPPLPVGATPGPPPGPPSAARVAIPGGSGSGVKADPLGLRTGAAVAVRMRAIYQLVNAADQAIATAHLELEANDVETAAEQACVAMLRLANACLDLDGLAPGSTRAVCVAYGERFGRTGRLYSAYHRWLLDVVDLRKASTHELTGPIDRAAAATAVERAEIFRDAVFRFAERNGG